MTNISQINLKPHNQSQNQYFFYTGNEGDIWGFYDNSGFVTTTLAQELGALVVFAEHRYFGKSFPFDKAYAFNAGNNTYLTVENTLMDYVELIK